jgi:hypothetical protein
MSITLDEVLLLTGRLDDSAGFDAPRQRFRRFLSDQLASARIGRAFIDQCPPLVDEQHHRALQDLVVFLGRSLGFEATFGAYAPVAGGLKHEGFWRSRARLEVVLEIRTNHTSDADLDSLTRSIAAHADASRTGSDARVLGLCVVTPVYLGRDRLEQAFAAAQSDTAVRIVSLQSLLLLADLASAGQLNHEDIVRLLDSVPMLDFVAGLLAKLVPASASDPSIGVQTPTRETQTSPGFWLATVAGDNAITAERFLEVVIGKRRIFGVRTTGQSGSSVRPGDRICFYVSGRGAVGQAEVALIAQSGTGLRDGHQYSHLLRLQNIELRLDAAIMPDVETTLRLRAAQGDASSTWQSFMRISERGFLALTGARDQELAKTGPDAAGGVGATRSEVPAKAEPPVSDAGSRSREGRRPT